MIRDVIVTPPDTAVRDQVRNVAYGILTQTGDRQLYRTTSLMIDGRIYFQAVALLAGDTVTNVITQITTGGTATSLSKVGVYDAAGNRLGISADQGSSWNSAGTKVVALTAPVAITVSGLYYLAIVAKTGTTMPTVIAGVAADPLAVGSGPPPGGTQSGQTDLVNPATISQSNNLNTWLACS